MIGGGGAPFGRWLAFGTEGCEGEKIRETSSIREAGKAGGTVDASVSARARHRTTVKWSYAYKRDDGLLVDRDAENDVTRFKKDGRQESAAATGEARKHKYSTKGDRNCASSRAEGLASVSCRIKASTKTSGSPSSNPSCGPLIARRRGSEST